MKMFQLTSFIYLSLLLFYFIFFCSSGSSGGSRGVLLKLSASASLTHLMALCQKLKLYLSFERLS